jgi:hypothetical protein
MKVIRPHCRVHFTATDVDFILTTLGRSPGDAAALRDLLADDATRDQILDHETLYRAVLEGAGCLQISSHLYFYVLVRHTLRSVGVSNRELADYIAELLAEFTRTDRTRARLPGEASPLDYFFEMVAALQRADARTAFALQLHIGNQALYYAGLFRERIEQRAAKKGFPSLSYYEGLGQTSFATASQHRLAEQLGLEELFAALADCFHAARLALNDVADRLVSLGDTDPQMERLLIRVR